LETTAETASATAETAWEPKIVAFVCSWCTTLAADLADTGGCAYAPNVRLVRVPCAGRINPLYIVRALQNGADGVLVCGCHPGDCHFVRGNLVARRRFALLESFLNYLGIEPERICFSWASGSEGARFAALARKATDDVRKLGPAKKLVKQR